MPAIRMRRKRFFPRAFWGSAILLRFQTSGLQKFEKIKITVICYGRNIKLIVLIVHYLPLLE